MQRRAPARAPPPVPPHRLRFGCTTAVLVRAPEATPARSCGRSSHLSFKLSMMAARVVAVAVLLVLAGRVNAAAAEPMTSARGHLPELAGAYKLPSKPQGTVDAAYGVLTRTLGAAAASQFTLRFIDPSPSEDAMPSTAAYCAPGVPPPCFRISGGGPGANVTIEGTGASELTAGLGMYLREYCNATIGWPRGGGSSVVVPPVWPAVESAGVAKRRYVKRRCARGCRRASRGDSW